MALDDAHRRLAPAEAGNGDLPDQLAIGGLQTFVELLRLDGEAQLHFIGREFLKRSGHSIHPPELLGTDNSCTP